MLYICRPIRLLLPAFSFLLILPGLRSQDVEFCPLYNFGTHPSTTPGASTDDPLYPRTPSRIAAPGDGWLYSTSNNGGGALNQGTIFKITQAGELTVIWKFDGRDTGSGPQGGLTDGKDGYLYGTTGAGGNYGSGTIFRIPYGASAGTRPEILHHFRNGSVLNLAPELCDAQKRCTYSPRQRADISASYAISPPVKGPDGNLHGVTGYSNNQQYGTVYSIPPTGGEKNFHVTCIFQPALLNDKDMKDFVCTPDTKLANPAVLIVGNDGNFYGTTYAGFGAVFRVDGTKVTPLHEFQYTDGSKPLDLMQGSDGRLYGTTAQGGSVNWGVIYRLDPQTKEFKSLYEFVPKFPAGQNGNPPWSGSPGAAPSAGLVEGRAGWLYGAASTNGRPGRGVIFRIPTLGRYYEVLHEFNFRDGRVPDTTPIFVGPDMFGMTFEGGWNDKTNGISDGGVFYRLSVDQPNITDVPVGMLKHCAHQQLSPPDDGPCLLVDDPMVQVSVHVTVKQITQPIPDPMQTFRPPLPTPEIDDAIAVHLNCTDRPHIVQFIYREKIGPDGPYHGELSSTAGNYLLTIDPKSPCWNPDSLSQTTFYIHKRDPYYEDGRQARRGCSGLTIFDDPSFTKTNNPDAPSTIFVDNRNETWRTHARDYLICGGKVQKQLDWVVEQKFGGPRTYSVLPPVNVTEMPDEFLGLLANHDFLLPFPLKNALLATQTGPACAQ